MLKNLAFPAVILLLTHPRLDGLGGLRPPGSWDTRPTIEPIGGLPKANT